MDAMIITFPNFLTILRIIVIPFFVATSIYGSLGISCVIFAMASLTDILDGYLARKLNQQSKLGAILDPIADKLFITTAFIILAFPKEYWTARIPTWIIITAITRDLLILIAAVCTYNHTNIDRFKPSILGKITTFIEIIAIFITLTINASISYIYFNVLIPWIYYLMSIMIIVSGVHYFIRKNNKKLLPK